MPKEKIINLLLTKILIIVIILVKCSNHYINQKIEGHCNDFNVNLKDDIRFSSAKLAYLQGDYLLASSIYNDILSQSIENDNRIKVVYSLINLAMVYAKIGDYKKAVKTIDRAIYKNNFIREAKIRENIFFYTLILESRGVIEQEKKSYDKSISYLKKALGVYLYCKQPIRVISTYNYLGISYYYKSQYDNSLNYFFNSLSLSNEKSYFDSFSLSLFFIGKIYTIKKNYNRALEYFNAALVIDKRNSVSINISEDLYELGGVYFLKKDYKKAKYYYNRSLELLVGMGNVKKAKKKWKAIMLSVTDKIKKLKSYN